jgi:flagellar motility protein MotE (MotC chaperone)
MLKPQTLFRGLLGATLAIGFSTPSLPQETQKPALEVRRAPSEAGDGVQQYCANIANAAADARIAWQTKRLGELQTQLKQTIAEFEAKEAESRDWVAKREAFLKKAQDGVVAVYAKMDSEAAAEQMNAMEEATAAAILSKLNPRIASAILDEMDAGKAAKLTSLMSGATVAAANRTKS